MKNYSVKECERLQTTRGGRMYTKHGQYALSTIKSPDIGGYELALIKEDYDLYSGKYAPTIVIIEVYDDPKEAKMWHNRWGDRLFNNDIASIECYKSVIEIDDETRKAKRKDNYLELMDYNRGV